ncbi:hypothetical protein KSS87_010546 [Heliosperma pusillum]|nr:hypothetical protein KSS87_010546 [Heliosperma pusillum]
MYVTRPLSLYKKSSESLLSPPPEGPNSGFLVIHDEETLPTCFGISNAPSIIDLPLPSNKILKVNHGPFEDDDVFAIPVLDQPLSSNRYYLIKAHGKHKGKAYSCSKKEDRGIGCGKSYLEDKKPRPLDPQDIYQQFEINTIITCTNNNGFNAKSITPDGHVPRFLRNIPTIQVSNSNNLIQESSKGLDRVLRSKQPDFDFPLTRVHSESVNVGKWVCPFMFIHEGNVGLGDQVKKSMYYEMTLEQRWERVFTADNGNSYGGKIMMDVVVSIQEVKIGGKDGVIDEGNSNNKVVWFRTIGSVGEELSVGLSTLIVERMIWEQRRVGWVNEGEKQVRIVKEEEYGGIGWWVKFGCYVLVERFVLTRMDGSLVFTCDFKHTHQMKTKWE